MHHGVKLIVIEDIDNNYWTYDNYRPLTKFPLTYFDSSQLQINGIYPYCDGIFWSTISSSETLFKREESYRKGY